MIFRWCWGERGELQHLVLVWWYLGYPRAELKLFPAIHRKSSKSSLTYFYDDCR